MHCQWQRIPFIIYVKGKKNYSSTCTILNGTLMIAW